jgi:hypothetical protein
MSDAASRAYDRADQFALVQFGSRQDNFAWSGPIVADPRRPGLRQCESSARCPRLRAFDLNQCGMAVPADPDLLVALMRGHHGRG